MVAGILAAILAVLASAFASFPQPIEQFRPLDPPSTTHERPAEIRESIRTLREMIREFAALQATRQAPRPNVPDISPPEMPAPPSTDPAPDDGCRTRESSGANWSSKTTVCTAVSGNASSASVSQSSTSSTSVTVRTDDSP